MEINELIKSVDIVEYISQFVELTQRGEEWWGLSCFKNENTPSFSVRKDHPVFYDYYGADGAYGYCLYGKSLSQKPQKHRREKPDYKQYSGVSGKIKGNRTYV